MIARRHSNPFDSCPYLTQADVLRGLYPVAFFENQIVDAFENVDSYSFNINCVPDILDVDIQITQLGALAALGGYVGAAMLSYYGASFALFLQSGVAITGQTVRQACPPLDFAGATAANPQGLPYPLCRDLCFQHVFSKNLTLLVIDFGATKRKLGGTKQSRGGMLFYPRISFVSYLGGYFLSNDIMMLAGAGTCIGGIDIPNSQGVLGANPELNCLTASGPPVGTPSVFGSLVIASRYDALKWSLGPNGDILRFSGVPFDTIPTQTGTPPNQGIFFGRQQADQIISQSDGSITVVLPAGFKKDYVTFRSAKGNAWSSSIPVEVS
jgi:hypothetical protein